MAHWICSICGQYCDRPIMAQIHWYTEHYHTDIGMDWGKPFMQQVFYDLYDLIEQFTKEG